MTDVDVKPFARPAAPKAATHAPGPKAPKRRKGVLGVWDSSIGKKYVMAVTGLLMLAFLVLHMLGDLKIFFGKEDFNHYAHFLRTIGTPVVHEVWYLWVQRFVLTAVLVLHVTSAYQLSRRDQQSRPVKYAHTQPKGGRWTTHSMRWGGLALLLFIIWHVMDLSGGIGNSKFDNGDVYDNVVSDFSRWWPNVIYIVAMIALGLHINHGFWSASMTLGYNRPKRNAAIKGVGTFLAVGISVGFIIVPVGVMAGWIS